MDGDGVQLTAYTKTTEVDSKQDQNENSSELKSINNKLTAIKSSLEEIVLLQKKLLVLLKVTPTVIACLKSNFLKYE